MKLTPLVSAAAALALLAPSFASAGVVRSVGHGYQNAHVTMTSTSHTRQSCPSEFFLCTSVSQSSPANEGICISDTSPPNCTSGLAPGTWSWETAQFKTKNNKPMKKLVSSTSPNPGNPVTITISEKKKVKSSKGAYKYYMALEACASSSDCAAGDVGIATE
jgi:hypothetical protein